jgi:hypothetical protein
LKRLILSALFAVLITPCIASAQWHWFPEPPPHPTVTADQLNILGFAAAALIGLVGYLALRKRTTA